MREEKIHSVYNLVCPIDGQIKYVGFTNNLVQRYIQHVVIPSNYCRSWLKDLKKKGLRPIMNELESELTYLDGKAAEKKWIIKIQNEHGTLLNRHHVKIIRPSRVTINYLNKPL